MPLRVVQEAEGDGTIPLRELRRGQVAEVVRWNTWSCSVGQLVIRHPMSIGGVTFDNNYSAIPEEDEIRVRVLANGTKLVVWNNE